MTSTKVAFHPIGRWPCTKLLWLTPFDAGEPSYGTLDVAPDELRYTWSFEGHPHEGVMRLAPPEGDGNDEVVLTWHDTFHAAGGMRLVGRVAGEVLAVSARYPDGVGGPDWGWRIEVSLGAPRVRMFNITPAGEEALAVDLGPTTA